MLKINQLLITVSKAIILYKQVGFAQKKLEETKCLNSQYNAQIHSHVSESNGLLKPFFHIFNQYTFSKSFFS
jgi:hypothetical protein